MGRKLKSCKKLSDCGISRKRRRNEVIMGDYLHNIEEKINDFLTEWIGCISLILLGFAFLLMIFVVISSTLAVLGIIE
jgi:hypothetical protein